MVRRLCLLGTPHLETDGAPEPLPGNRPASLLIYLAQRQTWVARSELAFLYSPEAPEKAALSNVRKLLHRARDNPWAEPLQTETNRVRFPIPTDVQLFEQAFSEERWGDALDLYRGPFLQDFVVPDLAGYEAWLELEREALAERWKEALERRARQLEHEGDPAGAAALLAQRLRHDPLDEEALQGHLRALHAAGRRTQALEAFKTFRRTLERELAIEPLEATLALVEAIRQRPASGVGIPEPAATAHNLPAFSTRLVGRERELEHLGAHLRDPDGRLLTLAGLGGVGKTRLALELAWRSLEVFPDGVWFVPLAGLGASEALATALAGVLGIESAGTTPAEAQLTGFLRDRRTLLVLDNVEHLLEGAPLLERLLRAAPRLSLLVTSRSALELSAERLVDLDGLPAPAPDAADPLLDSPAVQLFCERAGRRNPPS